MESAFCAAEACRYALTVGDCSRDTLKRYETLWNAQFGFEILRLEIDGRTKIIPQDCARREQSRTHERSFPDVAAVGNPAIPTRVTETCVEAVTRPAPSQRSEARFSGVRTHSESGSADARRATLSVGTPRFHYSINGSRQTGTSMSSGVVQIID